VRIVVTGLIATYPLGGLALDYLQYVRGLQALGHEVTYLEDTGRWVYAPWAETYTDQCARNVAYLATVLAALPAPVAWAFRDPTGRLHGMDEARLRRTCAAAELFLNVSGACWLRDEYRGAGVAAYLDTDPSYSQATLLAAEGEGEVDAAVAYTAAMIRRHDVFLTVAENIGTPGCGVPTAGLTWIPTRPPIVLDDWPWSAAPSQGHFTTVMSWRIDVSAPVIAGRRYGGKDVEFRRILDLPSRTPVPLELALAGAAPRDELAAAGWHLVDARTVSATPASYRDYLRHSRGELSVAKEAYTATASGWFSSRSAAYLALGRPVVVQDTGLRRHHPVGRGLLVFADVDEAAAALALVAGAYAEHAAAARALAAEAFDARRVLGRLLDDVL
jgi:hypothetical protein